MGAHPDAYKRLRKLLLRTCSMRRHTNPAHRATLSKVIDKLLDEWYDYSHRATEWDAQHWGFDDEWMVQERRNMRKQERMVKGSDGRWYAIH